jgi:carboxypeptidase C (cathepsin A)
MTWGGIQGFTRKPATPWSDDSGKFTGIIHQERNVTYAFFPNAGHLVPRTQPEAVRSLGANSVYQPTKLTSFPSGFGLPS